MKYLTKEQSDKVNELAKSGNKTAEDFLFNFMSLSDEEANKALADLMKPASESPIVEAFKALIADEGEAVDGYDKVLKMLETYKTAGKLDDADKYIKALEGIRKDEFDHTAILQGLIEGVK
jgi:hypothetical protein